MVTDGTVLVGYTWSNGRSYSIHAFGIEPDDEVCPTPTTPTCSGSGLGSVFIDPSCIVMDIGEIDDGKAFYRREKESHSPVSFR